LGSDPGLTPNRVAAALESSRAGYAFCVSSWPEPVERVTSFLARTGAEVRVEEFPAGTPTAQAAAEAIGCKLSEIVKSLVFDCDGRTVLALIPGDHRADPVKVARAVDAGEASVAPAARVRERTGFDPGAVAPFPPARVDRVLIDAHLLLQDHVWVGAGSPRHMARLAPAELIRLTRAEYLDLAADP
jgi:prolyl-tRNA editing enzyme YbaK/EbsC (Cys-tRNA(Pro) deacylase)